MNPKMLESLSYTVWQGRPPVVSSFLLFYLFFISPALNQRVAASIRGKLPAGTNPFHQPDRIHAMATAAADHCCSSEIIQFEADGKSDRPLLV